MDKLFAVTAFTFDVGLRRSPKTPKGAAEVVCLDDQGIADFDALHSRAWDHTAIACAFDLLMRNGADLRRKPLSERKAILRKALRAMKKVFSTSSTSRGMALRCLTRSASSAWKASFLKS